MTNSLPAPKVFTHVSGLFRRASVAAPGVAAPGEARPPAVQASARWRADRQFLPAALEIIETPPSPIRMALIGTICAFVTLALAWSWVGRLDIVAVASGKIQPHGRVKTIQSEVTGRVDRLEARNGDRVAAGDVLFTLDAGEPQADVAQSTTDLASSRAEVLRRSAAVASVHAPAPVAITWPDDIPDTLKTRQEELLASDLAQLRATVRNLTALLEQKRAEQQRVDGTIAAQGALVATLKERVDMRSGLAASGAGAKAAVIDARESYETQAANLAYQQGQRGETEAAIAVAQSEIDKAYATFVADNNQKREEAERQADDAARKLEKANVRLTQTVVRAPIAGTVQGSTITTIGQVLRPGEEVMRIVPEGERLEVEAYLPNKDIGFVQPGQKAVLKVESFPFTRYGTLEGKVVRVASDAIPEPEAEMAEAAPARTAGESGVAGGQRTHRLVFPITIELERETVGVDGHDTPLVPGMSVSAEIRTGSRRILDYLLSPVVEVSSSAMKER